MNPRMGQATAAYRQAAASVHPTVAVVRLYDATLLAILQAIRAREASRFEECFTKVMRAATILRGLDQALDYDKGGAVAERLHRVYRSYILSLHLSYGKPDVIRRYSKLHDSLVELRDAWASIAGLAAYVRSEPSAQPEGPAPVAPRSIAGGPSDEDLANGADLVIGMPPGMVGARAGGSKADALRAFQNVYGRHP